MQFQFFYWNINTHTCHLQNICHVWLHFHRSLTTERRTTLNPATVLPTADDGMINIPIKDITDVPILNPDIIIRVIDGSVSKNIDGTNKVGQAVVTLTSVLEAQPLASLMLTQAAERMAETEEEKKKLFILTGNMLFSNIVCTTMYKVEE